MSGIKKSKIVEANLNWFRFTEMLLSMMNAGVICIINVYNVSTQIKHIKIYQLNKSTGQGSSVPEVSFICKLSKLTVN